MSEINENEENEVKDFFDDMWDIGIRVRAIIGVPEELLPDDVISSPTFLVKSKKYILKRIGGEDILSQLDKNLIRIAYLYYICYLLCSGMYARVPKQMENLSTKTILLSIDWDARALDMLGQCNETLDMALEDIEEQEYYGTFANLTDESPYPNENL